MCRRGDSDHYGITNASAHGDRPLRFNMVGTTKDGVEAVHYMVGGVKQMEANTWGMGSGFHPFTNLRSGLYSTSFLDL